MLIARKYVGFTACFRVHFFETAVISCSTRVSAVATGDVDTFVLSVLLSRDEAAEAIIICIYSRQF